MTDDVAPPPLFPTADAAATQVRPVVWSKQARPLGGLHAWLKGSLVAVAILDIVLLLLSGSLLWIYAALEGGVLFSDFQLNTYDLVTGYAGMVAGPLYTVMYVIAAFLYCRFIFRALENLDLSKAHGDRIPPGWAVAYNFIPIMNFWKPVQAMAQAWRGSLDPDRNSIKPPEVIGPWWAFWLITNFVANYSLRLWFSTGVVDGEIVDFEAYKTTLWLDSIASVTSVISICFLLPIIAGITRAQDERLRLSRSPPNTSAVPGSV